MFFTLNINSDINKVRTISTKRYNDNNNKYGDDNSIQYKQHLKQQRQQQRLRR
jgi:hypothetical protein